MSTTTSVPAPTVPHPRCGRPDGPADLLPTPTVGDSRNSRNATAGRTDPGAANDGWTLADVAHAARWGEYGPAVARWEGEHGPAPEPMICRPSRPVGLGRRGRDGLWLRPHDPQLNPVFVEWMQGVEPGWVTSSSILGTEVPGMTSVQLTERGTWAGERAAMLSLLGDGVVVPYIAASIRYLLPLVLAEVADLTPAERGAG